MASDSGQSSQTSVGGSGQQPETSSALNLLKTRDWLKSQLHDYRSDTTTGAESSPGTSDILQLSRRLKSLQDELFFKTLDLDKKEQLTKRIQLGHALEGYLFPEGGEDEEVSAEMKERRLHLEQLVNKQADLVSRISKIHEEMTEARPGLEALKKENFEMKKKSREVVDSIRERRDLMEESAKNLADDTTTKRNHGYLTSVVEKITVKRHMLQALVLGSGIEWFRDSEQQQLVLELGETLNF